MYTIKYSFLWFSILFCCNIKAQISTWIGINLNKSIGKRTEIGVGYEYRTKNSQPFDKSNLEFFLAEKWTKGIETFIKYRNSIENNKYSYLNDRVLAYNNRISIGLDVSFLRLFDISKRTKLNWTIVNQYDNFQFKRNSTILRNKLSIKHDIKDFFISPFLSFEHFYKWNRDIIYSADEIIIAGGTSALRYFLGTEFEITKNQRIVLSIGLRESILNNRNYLFRLSYKAKF